MALMLADPDENCPGGVYYAMALRIQELESDDAMRVRHPVMTLSALLDAYKRDFRPLPPVAAQCNENDGGIGGCPVHPEGCGI